MQNGSGIDTVYNLGCGEQKRHHDSWHADDALRDARHGAEAVVHEPPSTPYAIPGKLRLVKV